MCLLCLTSRGRPRTRMYLRQPVVSADHPQGIPGKKALHKGLKGDDFGENGRRAVGEEEEKASTKMPGGRLKVSSAYHSKEHKGSKDHKDHKDRKDEKDGKEYNEHHSKADDDAEIKAAEGAEAMDEETESHSRRAQDGETLLQWGQRKRPRHREPSGLLKTSIRVDRRVVRADKQVAVQPASQSRGNGLRHSQAAAAEPASAPAKRASDAPASGAGNSESDHVLSNNGHQLQNGDQEEQRPQHPASASNLDKPPSANGGGHAGAAGFFLRRTDGESILEKSHAVEKLSMDLFEWPKIVTSLTRKEKEDDFTAIKGTKLSQRPKRRPKTVEKNVQFISPGTWLCDLSRDRYEVREKKAVKKKPRGLKAMGSVDSDSD